MFAGKRAFPNDSNSYQVHTPNKSPRRYMCIPNNTPESSPSSGIQSPSSAVDRNQEILGVANSVANLDFEKQLLQALISKIPNRIGGSSTDGMETNYSQPSALPLITLSPNNQRPTDSLAELSVKNLQNYDYLNGKMFQSMDWDKASSFSDQLSIMATCASECSNLDLTWDEDSDFSDDGICKKTQSLSLDDLSTAEDLPLQTESTKCDKKTSSLRDVHTLE